MDWSRRIHAAGRPCPEKKRQSETVAEKEKNGHALCHRRSAAAYPGTLPPAGAQGRGRDAAGGGCRRPWAHRAAAAGGAGPGDAGGGDLHGRFVTVRMGRWGRARRARRHGGQRIAWQSMAAAVGFGGCGVRAVSGGVVGNPRAGAARQRRGRCGRCGLLCGRRRRRRPAPVHEWPRREEMNKQKGAACAAGPAGA